MLNDSPKFPEWSTLSKKEQGKRLVGQMFGLAIVYAWIAFQLLTGVAYYGRRVDKTALHLQDHPIPFCIVIILEMALFAGMAFFTLRGPLLKGWQKSDAI